ncbi:MAG: 1-phosphofructokinase [Eubacteriales bacterium]
MITTVTLNPAIDRTIIVNQFEYGSVNRVATSREDIGGKGINVARILLALGTSSRAVGFIGRTNYPQALTLLQKDAIPTEFIFIDAPTRTNIKLLESSTHTTTDINEAGFAVSEQDLEAVMQLVSSFADQSTFIVFSGSVPKGLDSSTYRKMIEKLPPHCKVALDAEGMLLMESLKAEPFLIKPNIHELESALGRTLGSNTEVVGAANDLIRLYNITYVLVSMGGNGSILVTKDQALYAAPLSVNVKGTVGAGDSMLAGFIHGLAQGFDIPASLAWATACGALAVSQEGTQAFEKSDVEKLAALVLISAIS